ncbi:uncharacterized protein LOC144663130 [Oculina patagonica]
MQAKEESFPSLDFEKELERAKWFKEDLEKGGWNERFKVPGRFESWSKTFPEQEVAVKVLFLFQLPLSAEKFAEMVHPSNMDIRTKWDEAFADLETLEVGPDEARIVSTRIALSCPLSDRDMVLFVSPTKQVDWYGKKSYAMFVKNASHPSKPAGRGGLVRATNGGNFYIACPDENDPENKCQVFGLTNNNYNGWLPNARMESVVGKRAPETFHKLQDNIIEGYKKYFMKDENEM